MSHHNSETLIRYEITLKEKFCVRKVCQIKPPKNSDLKKKKCYLMLNSGSKFLTKYKFSVMNSVNRGLLINFEGLDRSGKSTQAKLLKDFLEKNRGETSIIRFPGLLSLSHSTLTLSFREIDIHWKNHQ